MSNAYQFSETTARQELTIERFAGVDFVFQHTNVHLFDSSIFETNHHSQNDIQTIVPSALVHQMLQCYDVKGDKLTSGADGSLVKGATSVPYYEVTKVLPNVKGVEATAVTAAPANASTDVEGKE